MLGKIFREDSPARQKVKSFRSKPEAYVSNVYNGFPDIVKNSYLFLENHVMYDSKMTKLAKAFTKDGGDEWDFAQMMSEDERDLHTSHTAESEYNVLDMSLIYSTFRHEDSRYIIMRIHYGKDIRAGYTEPMVFIVYDDIDILDHDMHSVDCSCDCGQCDYYRGEFDWYGFDDNVNDINFPNTWHIDGREIKCTKCNKTVILY